MYLYMLCSEYHDVYSPEHSFHAADLHAALEYAEQEEWSLLGYACIRELHGPVHPKANAYIPNRAGERGYRAPMMKDIWPAS